MRNTHYDKLRGGDCDAVNNDLAPEAPDDLDGAGMEDVRDTLAISVQGCHSFVGDIGRPAITIRGEKR